ncbi:MAG: hypothetical protein HOO66_06280 [Nitrosarchaeum sp.]|nr:hypothetical protein [Nitrosarchaeum sp.]
MKFLINKKVAVGLIIICGIIIVNVYVAFTNLLNFSFISSVVIIGVILLVFFILNQEAIIKKNKEKEQLDLTDATAKEQLKFTDATAKKQLEHTDATAKEQLDLTDATAKEQLFCCCISEV